MCIYSSNTQYIHLLFFISAKARCVYSNLHTFSVVSATVTASKRGYFVCVYVYRQMPCDFLFKRTNTHALLSVNALTNFYATVDTQKRKR